MATEFKNVFFPTDFSKNAQIALPIAAEIAWRTDSKLILFHASQSAMDFAPNFEEAKEEAIKKAEADFESLIDDLKKDERFAGLEIVTILQSGHPTVGLMEKSKKYDSGIIVMGTKGATGDRNVIFGSTASSIINRSSIPVLAIPSSSKFDDFNHITFTTDYHEGDLEAMKQTVTFAKLFDSEIKVMHVAEEESLLSDIKFRGFRELVKEDVDYDKISFVIKYDYDFFPVMADYLIDNPETLLIMVRHKKTFWEKLVERDHSKEMAFYSRVPLLVLMGRSVQL
ncbi:universal stress protein [Balneolaceae bacterium YR4-1]|uniref:Universal stress protein n=1 Tax=Halalkalibaculum roseum TaxID=2709311 RepID=A0A6M1SKW9_9BACT|nr:universal stress protein [Halalkalibaculum roseum]NGP75961.1 universal stress protein [Halalkalibaculum roseum]